MFKRMTAVSLLSFAMLLPLHITKAVEALSTVELHHIVPIMQKSLAV